MIYKLNLMANLGPFVCKYDPHAVKCIWIVSLHFAAIHPASDVQEDFVGFNRLSNGVFPPLFS